MTEYPSKILLVDDDPTTALLIKKGLEKKDFEVEHFLTSEEGLEMAMSGNFALILLDIDMPGLSGFDVLKKIRAKFATLELPVIMVTGRSQSEDTIRALRLEANDYLAKPIQLEVVEARVKTQLALGRLYRTSLEKSELEAIKATMVTYNHEINNPLAIAMMAIQRCEQTGDTDILVKATRALDRIAELVRRITELNKPGAGVAKQKYIEGGSSMLDLGIGQKQKKQVS